MSLPYIRIDDRDNVAIILTSGRLHGSGAHSAIEQIALKDFDADEPVIRYGQVIGYAASPIPQSSWIRPEMLDMPEPPSLDQLPLATSVPAPSPPLEGYTFEGYRNADGSTGTRNLLGITTTVQCGRRRWIMPCGVSRQRSCRATRMSMT